MSITLKNIIKYAYIFVLNGDRNCLKFCKNASDLKQPSSSVCTRNTEITF